MNHRVHDHDTGGLAGRHSQLRHDVVLPDLGAALGLLQRQISAQPRDRCGLAAEPSAPLVPTSVRIGAAIRFRNRCVPPLPAAIRHLAGSRPARNLHGNARYLLKCDRTRCTLVCAECRHGTGERTAGRAGDRNFRRGFSTTAGGCRCRPVLARRSSPFPPRRLLLPHARRAFRPDATRRSRQDRLMTIRSPADDRATLAILSRPAVR